MRIPFKMANATPIWFEFLIVQFGRLKRRKFDSFCIEKRKTDIENAFVCCIAEQKLRRFKRNSRSKNALQRTWKSKSLVFKIKTLIVHYTHEKQTRLTVPAIPPQKSFPQHRISKLWEAQKRCTYTPSNTQTKTPERRGRKHFSPPDTKATAFQIIEKAILSRNTKWLLCCLIANDVPWYEALCGVFTGRQ